MLFIAVWVEFVFLLVCAHRARPPSNMNQICFLSIERELRFLGECLCAFINLVDVYGCFKVWQVWASLAATCV